MSSTEKTVLVTGANRGLGLEVVKELAKRGCRVFLGARNHEAGLKALASLPGTAGRVEVVQLDVADSAKVGQAARELAQRVDHLDVLVNNAGIYLDEDTTILDAPLDLIVETLNTNTLGPIRLVHALLPLLNRSRGARVINMSSGMGQLSDMGGGSPGYRLSKTALNAVTRQLAVHLKERGMAVNSVCPGWVRTDMGGANATRSPQQGADTAVWLALDAPQSLTGEFLRDRRVIPW